MNSMEKFIYLQSIGWKDGDPELTDDQIAQGIKEKQAAKEAARASAFAKVGLTADEMAALFV